MAKDAMILTIEQENFSISFPKKGQSVLIIILKFSIDYTTVIISPKVENDLRNRSPIATRKILSSLDYRSTQKNAVDRS